MRRKEVSAGMELHLRKARKVSVIMGLLECPRQEVYRLIAQGELDGYRIGHLCYVYLDSVNDFKLRQGLMPKGGGGEHAVRF